MELGAVSVGDRLPCMKNPMRLFALVLSVILASLAAVAVASPAQAAPPASCPATQFCGYVHSHYNTGGGYELYPLRPAGSCHNVAFNDSWSSAYNRSGRDVRIYLNANCSGSDPLTVPNGRGIESFDWDWWPNNDEASSIKFL